MLYEGQQVVEILEELENDFKSTYEYINKKLASRYSEKEIEDDELYLEADAFQSAMFRVQYLKNKIEA